MRVLVTGGSGFIGTNLVEDHLRRGDRVLSADSREPRNPAHLDLWRRSDLLDRDGLFHLFEEFEPTHLLHMGARTDLHGTTLPDYAANLEGVDNVIEAARRSSSLERAVFASSRMVCRIDHRPVDENDYSPPNPYGESKMLGELRVRDSGLEVPWTLVRPTSIWGPWFDVPYKDFFLAVGRGRYVHVRGGSARKSFGYVGNTVYQLQKILSAPVEQVHGRTLYLGDYPPIETHDMAERIRAEMGAPPIRTVPRGLLRLVARGGDAAKRLGWREPPLTSFRLANLTAEMVYDLGSLEEVAGALPHDLDEGIRVTVGWMRESGEIPGRSGAEADGAEDR